VHVQNRRRIDHGGECAGYCGAAVIIAESDKVLFFAELENRSSVGLIAVALLLFNLAFQQPLINARSLR